jgi:hypothetical protein
MIKMMTSTPTATVTPNENVDVLSQAYRQSYHELLEKPVVEADVLSQLKSNLNQLEDLHGRLKLMMGEISYLLKKS